MSPSNIGSTHFDPGFTNITVPPKRTAVLAGTGQLVSGLPTGKGGVYITGHDPDYHAYAGGNAAGAQNILKRAINWVTFGKANPKILLVTDLRNPGGDESDPRNGLTAAGFTYDIADDGSSGSALDLHTVDFTKYSVVVVASDYGGWLRQEELDILKARSADVISYINGGGGLVALAECGCRGNGTGTTHDRFGFLPSVVSSAALNQGESGFTLTSTGTEMGLATSDINGNASHNIFTAGGGLDTVDLDSAGHIISLAERGQQVGTSNFDTSEAGNIGVLSGAFGPSPLNPSPLQAGSAGFVAQPFATEFPNENTEGPIGVTFDPAGNLYVGDVANSQLYKFGSPGGAAPSHQLSTKAIAGLGGLTFSKSGRLYAAAGEQVVELDSTTGVVRRVVASGFFAEGMATDPLSGDLFVSSSGRGQPTMRISGFEGPGPVKVTAYGPNFDGLAFAPDGTLYGAGGTAATESQIYKVAGTDKPQPAAATVIANVPHADGIALFEPPPGQSVTKLAVNRTDGIITEVNTSTEPATLTNIITGGTRGDFVATGPDGCLYATQSTNVVRVTEANGSCPFIPPPSTCSASALVPQVHVTVGGATTTFADTSRVLTHGGIDAEACATQAQPARLWIGNDIPGGGNIFATDISGNVVETVANNEATSVTFDGSSLYFNYGATYEQRTLDGQHVLRTFTVPGAGPRSEDGAWDTKRSRLWYAHDEGCPACDINYLSRLDVNTATEDQRISLPTTIEGVAYSAVGLAYDSSRDLLYVGLAPHSSGAPSIVNEVDPNSGQIVGTLFRETTFGVTGLAYDPENDTLWAGGGDGVTHVTRGGTVLSHFAKPQPGGDGDGLEYVPVVVPGGALSASWFAAAEKTPDQVCPAWSLSKATGPPAPVLSGGSLEIANTGLNQPVKYVQEEPVEALSHPEPLVIEARMRVLSSTSAEGTRAAADIGFVTAPNIGNGLFIESGHIFLNRSETERGETAAVNTSSFHDYRIEVTRAGAITVFQDGKQVLAGSEYTSAADNGGKPRIEWGNGSIRAYGLSQWQAVRHNAASCSTPINESHAWQQISGTSTVEHPLPPATTLTLAPAGNTQKVVDQSQTIKVAAMDQGGHPVGAGVAVSLAISGANAQPALTRNTDSSGTATFSYVGSKAGTDAVSATAFLAGLRSVSNTASLTWTIPAPGGPTPVQSGPSPPSVTITTPSDGSMVSAAAPVAASIVASANQSISSWKVAYQNNNGGSTVTLATGTGAPPATLATFEPAGQQAGTYAITVSATSSSGGSATVVTHVIVGGPAGSGSASQAPPTVTNVEPADETEVTQPTCVKASIEPPAGGSVASVTVTAQAHTAGSSMQTLPRGKCTEAGQLAELDPTMLSNDTYTISVAASGPPTCGSLGCGVATQTASTTVVVAGNLKLGRYTTTYQDLSVPVNGFQMEARRVYDSTDKRVGDFGVGWHVELSNFRVSVNRELGAGGWAAIPTSCVFGFCKYAFKSSVPHYVTVTYPDGHQETFDFMPKGGEFLEFYKGKAEFTARPDTGTTGRLEAEGNSSVESGFDGNLYGGGGIYNPTRFVLAERNGTKLKLDASSGLVSEEDRNGNSLSIDEKGIHASNGQSIIFTRDSQGRIAQIQGLTGKPLTYTYSPAGDLESSTDANGHETTYAYDSMHDLTKSAGAGMQPLFTLHYDSAGRIVSITDANNHETTISNNVASRQQTITDPLGLLTTIDNYDARGDLEERVQVPVSGPRATESFKYDSVGRITQTTDADGRHTKTRYDENGDPVEVTDISGRTTTLHYDEFGDLTSIEDSAKTPLATVSYDSSGNVKRISRPDGSYNEYGYDPAGHLTSSTDALGDTTRYEYDSSGHLSAIVNPLKKVTKVSVNPDGTVHSTTDPEGGEYTLEYDGDGNVTKITDPRHHTWSRFYDPLERLEKITGPSGTEQKLSYEPAGNLGSFTDANGTTTEYSYDADGHLKSEKTPSQAITLARDALGRLESLTNQATKVAYSYDPAGQILEEATTGLAGSGVPNSTASYAYDSAGNMISRSGPEGTTKFGYDALGRLSSITDPANREFTSEYDPMSRLTGLTRPGGLKDTLTYDLTGQLATRTTKAGSTVVASYATTRDAAGRTTTITRADGTEKISYDALGRVIEVSGPNRPTEKFTYDAGGNRTGGPTASSVTPVYDEENRLLSDAKYTYTYDKDGRLETRTERGTGATTRYKWNGLGQLAQIQRPDGTTTIFTYDPLGRRIAVNTDASTSYYAYFENSPTAELAAGGKVTSKTVSLPGLDQPLETEAGGEPHYYVQDGQGNVVNVTNGSGKVLDTYSYGAFGQPVTAEGSTPNPFTFQAHEYDSADGIYYFRARYYDPSTGRFLSPDPAWHTNPYPLTNNDPINYIDPTGELLAEYAPLLSEQAKRGIALGEFTQCLAVGLLRGLNAEPEVAEEDLYKALGKYKKVLPYSGLYGDQLEKLKEALSIGKKAKSLLGSGSSSGGGAISKVGGLFSDLKLVQSLYKYFSKVAHLEC